MLIESGKGCWRASFTFRWRLEYSYILPQTSLRATGRKTMMGWNQGTDLMWHSLSLMWLWYDISTREDSQDHLFIPLTWSKVQLNHLKLRTYTFSEDLQNPSLDVLFTASNGSLNHFFPASLEVDRKSLSSCCYLQVSHLSLTTQSLRNGKVFQKGYK